MKKTALLCALLLALRAAASAAPADILPEDVRRAAAEIHWTPELVDRLIDGLPKVETHLHLDGSLSPATIRTLAERQHYAPLAGKSEAEIAALTVVDKPKDSLAEVLKAFSTVYPLLHTPDAVETMAYEAVAGAARDNARYVEVRFAPALQARGRFTSELALKAALKGLKRAEKDFGVKSGVIVCLIRPFGFVSHDKNAAMTALAIKYKDRGVVGIDLAGNEAAQPLSDYREFYALAKAAGLRMTAHAGEVPGSRDLETALELGVDRLGHALLLAEKPELLKKVVELHIPIEVNLTSNLRTSAVADLAHHPVKDWYAAGVAIALSTDDPGVFGVDLDHEYRLLSRDAGFSPVDVIAVADEGIDALFLPAARKRELRARFDDDVRALLRELAAPAREPLAPVAHRGRLVDLEAFLAGFPYTTPYVDVRSSRLFYKKKGATDVLMMASYDPAGAQKVDFAKGRAISPRDFSKRNLWGIFYSPLTKKVIMKADDHNEEIMNFVELDPGTGAERLLTHVGYIYDYDLSDDGRLLVYTSRAAKDELSPGDVRVLDLKTGAERVLFRDTPEMKMVWGSVSWRPGGRGVLVPFIAGGDRNKRNLLYVPVDPAQRYAVLTDTAVKRSVLEPLNRWLGADEFLYTSDEADFAGVYRGSLKKAGRGALVTAKGDNVKSAAVLEDRGRRRLVVVTGNPLASAVKLIAPETGAVLREEAFDGQAAIEDARGDRLMLSRSSLSDPFSDVELRASGAALEKTERASYPDELLKKIVRCDVEKVGFKTFDGLSTPGETGTMHAYLLKPKNPLPPDQERALVLSFYGGGNEYTSSFEILCDAGYYVLSPAPRGTTDFGAAYYRLAAGDLGGAETLDDFAAGKYLREKLGLPQNRIGIYGGSRGGYDTLRALTFPGEVNGVKEDFRFGFGVSGAGISDIARAMAGGNISQWYAMLTGGDPAKDPEKWRDRSPETHADLLSGPLLLVHGTNDNRVPIVESRSFYAKAKALGKDATLVEIEGQGHGFNGIDAQARYYRAVLDFLDKLR